MKVALIILFLMVIPAADCACTNCDNCINNQCQNKAADQCKCKNGCKNGFYGNKCLANCPVQCTSCGRYYRNINDPTYQLCYECSDGYYNSGTSTNCAYNCQTYCSKCTSYSQCTECKTGWYGKACWTQCSTGCKDSICAKSDGYCTNGCIANFEPGADGKCTLCTVGRYGNLCQDQCPTTCKDDICDQSAGTCTNGCIDNFAPGIDGKCSVCVDRKYDASTQCQYTCPQNCAHCTSSTWCTQCDRGWYGTTCASQCSAGCLGNVCMKSDGLCTQGCVNGRYGNQCQNSCPQNCTQCTSHSTCTACYNGWYGSTCTVACPSNCLNNMCNNSNGYCTQGCRNGYYGNQCQNECPSACKHDICHQSEGSCSYGCIGNFAPGADKKCNICIPGKYGGDCNSICPTSTCLNNQCEQSTGTCSNGCMINFALGDNNLCDVCKAGKYGNNCELSCPTTCSGMECNREDRKCSNGCTSPNITGTYCEACVNGIYGSNCQSDCSHNCKDKVCGRYDGVCTDGCEGEQFTGSKCDQCKVGFYGEECNSACPVNCWHNYCMKDNGDCTNGCVGNYTGKRCDDCNPGYYGDNCDLPCPTSKCTNNVCARSTGQCETCTADVYGHYCNQTCSAGCLGNTCNQETGDCEHGCKDSYTGNKCCVRDGHCEKCANTTHCVECLSGYYGDTCNETCPDNCLNGCSKKDGLCTSCKRRYFGQQCGSVCSNKCTNASSLELCDLNTGKCLQGCANGYYGDVCSYNCNTTCAGGTCTQNAGKCTECLTGYHGDTCNKTCNGQCVNSSCTQDDGKCIHGCSGGFRGHDCSIAQAIIDDPGNDVTGPVAGGVSAVLVVTVIVALVGFILFRRKRRDGHPQGGLKQFPSNSSTTPALDKINHQATYENEHNTHHVAEEQEDDDNADATDVGEVDPEYINIMESKSDIDVSDLYKYVSKADSEFFTKEFQQIPRASSHPYKDARNPENKSLNRFKGIFPYDHSRVKLKVDPGFFINACYIDGYTGDKSYIASVGPTADITSKYVSFWKMVWYEQSDVIVMLTNLSEPSGMKCEQYWPPGVGTSSTYGDITVTHQGINVYAEYNLTQLTVAKGKHQRSVTHIHYTAWPDKSVPDNVVSLVEFRQRVKAIKTVTGGPTIVHCSAGVGRTGTYIALDILTDRGKSEHKVNVFDCVMKLREQRVNMVQTHEQYEYLHRCIVYTLTFGSDPITVDNLQANVKRQNDKSYTRQFQVLGQPIEKVQEDETEARDINKHQSSKNRQGADIPGNRGRPRLFLNRAFNEPDYINAIYINSYKTMNRYIAAQTPLPTTLSDFLCLIYQNQCTCIVDMNDSASYNKHEVGTYLPAVGHAIKVDPYTISCTSREGNTAYTKSVLTVNNSSKQRPGEIRVEHYQYTGWHGDGEVPDNVAQFVQFVNTLQIAADNRADDSSPMLIHCLNAFERSGLFCTIAVLLEKLEGEQQISVSNTIRQIRLRRSKAIPNKAQYKFCHECAATYTDMFSTYSNFAM